jgi:hypothetical protein
MAGASGADAKSATQTADIEARIAEEKAVTDQAADPKRYPSKDEPGATGCHRY